MSFSVEKIDVEHCKVRINYKADTAVVSDKIKSTINKIRDWPVPGFRKGHATDLAIILKYREQINKIIAQELLSIANDDSIFETKIKAIGFPVVENHSMEGNNFSCQLLYYTKPSFELGQYKDLEIPKPQMDQSVEAITEEIIAGLRKQVGDVIPFKDDDFIQVGDKITMDFEVIGHPKEDAKLYVAGANIIPGLDENIFGMKVGETKEFELLFNNKASKCIVTVHMGLKIVPCGDDQELAKRTGEENFDKLLASATSFAQKRYDAIYSAKLQDQIAKRLVSSHKIDIPDFFIDGECKKLASNQQLEWDKLDNEIKEKIKISASNNATLIFVIDAIEEAETEIQLTQDETMNLVVEFLQSQGVQDIKGWLQENNNTNVVQQIIAQVKVGYIMKWLVSKAKVIE